MSEKTLRDEFAMAALTGILSGFWSGDGPPLDLRSADSEHARWLADAAGTVADAMMAERQKEG